MHTINILPYDYQKLRNIISERIAESNEILWDWMRGNGCAEAEFLAELDLTIFGGAHMRSLLAEFHSDFVDQKVSQGLSEKKAELLFNSEFGVGKFKIGRAA